MLCVITGYDIIGCVAFDMANACEVFIVNPIDGAKIFRNYFQIPCKLGENNQQPVANVGVNVICDVPSICDAFIG